MHLCEASAFAESRFLSCSGDHIARFYRCGAAATSVPVQKTIDRVYGADIGTGMPGHESEYDMIAVKFNGAARLIPDMIDRRTRGVSSQAEPRRVARVNKQLEREIGSLLLFDKVNITLP